MFSSVSNKYTVVEHISQNNATNMTIINKPKILIYTKEASGMVPEKSLFIRQQQTNIMTIESAMDKSITKARPTPGTRP